MTVRGHQPDASARRGLRVGLVLVSVALALMIGFALRDWVLGK